MNKHVLTVLWLFATPSIGLSNPDPAVAHWYVKWVMALLPITLGLVFHLLTLVVAAITFRALIQHRPHKRMSGVPFVGPFCIGVGLAWAPSDIPLWAYLLPWGLELAGGLACVVAEKRSHRTPV